MKLYNESSTFIIEAKKLECNDQNLDQGFVKLFDEKGELIALFKLNEIQWLMTSSDYKQINTIDKGE